MGQTSGSPRPQASAEGGAGADRRRLRRSDPTSGLCDAQAGRLSMADQLDESARMFREQRLRDVSRHSRMLDLFERAIDEAHHANDEALAMAVVLAIQGLATAMERTT